MTFNTYDFGLFSNGSVTAPVSARYASGITSPVGYIHRVDWDSRLNTSAANTTGCIIGSFYLIESGTANNSVPKNVHRKQRQPNNQRHCRKRGNTIFDNESLSNNGERSRTGRKPGVCTRTLGKQSLRYLCLN